MPEAKLTTAEAYEAGYFGTVPDETPNEAYTVAGVTGGGAAPPAAGGADEAEPAAPEG